MTVWTDKEEARLNLQADPKAAGWRFVPNTPGDDGGPRALHDAAMGRLHPENEDPADSEPAGEAAILADQLITGTAITNIPPPTPLIEGILDLDSLAVFYGRPGSGKTFAALDIAATIAAGADWHGRQVTPSDVIYIAAEGLGGLGQRTRAWTERWPERDISRLNWLPRTVNLLEQRWADGLAQMAASTDAKLIVIDTLARSMVGGEENSAKDMGRIVEALDRIRRTTQACVLVIHHLGKDSGQGMRGSNSLEGGVDTAWEITREGQWLTLNCQRQKNHPTNPEPLKFALANSAGSCVLTPDPRRASDTLPESIRTTLQALHDIETTGGTSTTVWLKTSSISERTFYRHVKRLLELRLIHNIGTDKQPRYQLTPEGHDALTTDITAN